MVRTRNITACSRWAAWLCLATALACACPAGAQQPAAWPLVMEQAPVEPPAEPALSAPARCEGSADSIRLGSGDLVMELLPLGLLWEPPIANQREPRTYVKFTSLDSFPTYDTAIGAEFALGRIGPASRPQEGVQLVLLAAGFMRFDDQPDLVAADYRVGCPLTWAWNDWQGKLGYEHTSSHTSDLLLNRWRAEGMYLVPPPVNKLVRDEVVLGLARRFAGEVRLYGQVGYSFATQNRTGPGAKDRYDWGLEWTPPARPGRRGAPVAAFDMDLREEHDFCPNTTVQVGWQWRVVDGRSSAARLVAEYYNGRSPYGLFLARHESWWALALSYDW